MTGRQAAADSRVVAAGKLPLPVAAAGPESLAPAAGRVPSLEQAAQSSNAALQEMPG